LKDPHLPEPLPQLGLHELFTAQAMTLQEALQSVLDWTAGRNTWGVSALRALLYDYIDKACTLASNLELLETPLPSMKDGQGNEALSGHDIQKATKPPSLVPVGTVFSLAFSTHCHQIATR
jgi:hypothetical protein